MPSIAHEVPQAIVLTLVQRIEGELVLETDCRDHEHFMSLPAVVSYMGTMCGKSGWSSDRNYACYRSGAAIARAISPFTTRKS